MYKLYHGDALDILKTFPENSIDSLVCDPPACIGFMQKDFDTFESRESFIKYLVDIFHEVLRVLKPGAHGFVWALPKTSHWTATSLENAGFEVKDIITHHFGQGFPKSVNLSRAIDKAANAPREVIGLRHDAAKLNKSVQEAPGGWTTSHRIPEITAPATEAAKKFDGWGSALKPATEFWILVRKPLSEKTLVKNVVKWGTGGLNIDETRVQTTDNLNGGAYCKDKQDDGEWGTMHRFTGKDYEQPTGRFPANVVMTHSEQCVHNGVKRVKSDSLCVNENRANDKSKNVYGDYKSMQGPNAGYAKDGYEEVEDWTCHESCPIFLMNEQSGILTSGTGAVKKSTAKGYKGNDYGTESRPEGTPMVSYGDTGGAARFFKNFDPFIYQAKPAKKEKNEGLENLENKHPTVKSTKLMSYLISMITPPGGTVLDCFTGSGSTGVAALNSGFQFIGIEKEQEYFTVAEARLESCETKSDLQPAVVE